MSSTPLESMGLQEVAKYWMYDNTYAAGNFFTVNLDCWNSLSAEAQAAIEDAAKATEEHSIEVYTEAIFKTFLYRQSCNRPAVFFLLSFRPGIRIVTDYLKKTTIHATASK